MSNKQDYRSNELIDRLPKHFKTVYQTSKL